MPTSTEPTSIMAWAGAAFFLIAVVRVYYVLTEKPAEGGFTDSQWRRRWLEVGILVAIALLLALLAYFLG